MFVHGLVEDPVDRKVLRQFQRKIVPAYDTREISDASGDGRYVSRFD